MSASRIAAMASADFGAVVDVVVDDRCVVSVDDVGIVEEGVRRVDAAVVVEGPVFELLELHAVAPTTRQQNVARVRRMSAP
jgi:hypothetical protein